MNCLREKDESAGLSCDFEQTLAVVERIVTDENGVRVETLDLLARRSSEIGAFALDARSR